MVSEMIMRNNQAKDTKNPHGHDVERSLVTSIKEYADDSRGKALQEAYREGFEEGYRNGIYASEKAVCALLRPTHPSSEVAR